MALTLKVNLALKGNSHIAFPRNSPKIFNQGSCKCPWNSYKLSERFPSFHKHFPKIQTSAVNTVLIIHVVQFLNIRANDSKIIQTTNKTRGDYFQSVGGKDYFFAFWQLNFRKYKFKKCYFQFHDHEWAESKCLMDGIQFIFDQE